MTKLITDKEKLMGLNVPTPTLVVNDSSTKQVTTTWSVLEFSPQEGDFQKNEFTYNVFDTDRFLPMDGQTMDMDYLARIDLTVASPLLLAKQLMFKVVPHDIEDDVEGSPFASFTVNIDNAILFGTSSFNAMYNITPFFIQSEQYYKIMVRTNIGTVDITDRSLVMTRNS